MPAHFRKGVLNVLPLQAYGKFFHFVNGKGQLFIKVLVFKYLPSVFLMIHKIKNLCLFSQFFQELI